MDVVYESKDLGDQEMSNPNMASATTANDPSDDTQGNVGITTENGPGKETGKVTVVKNMIPLLSSAETEDKFLPIDITTLFPPPVDALLDRDLLNHYPEQVNPLLVCPELIF